MTTPGQLAIVARGDREIVITRTFDSPRALVFEAFTKPDLLKKWFYGPDGWEMPHCAVDLRPGGAYRYEWRNTQDGSTMGVGGTYVEVTPPTRFVATQRFDEPWYPGECQVTQEFAEAGGRTTLTMTLRYESREGRDLVLQSPMEGGLALGYDRVAALLKSLS